MFWLTCILCVLSATTVSTVWLHQQKDVRGGHPDTSHRSLSLQSGQRLRRGNPPHCLSVDVCVCLLVGLSAYDCLFVCIVCLCVCVWLSACHLVCMWLSVRLYVLYLPLKHKQNWYTFIWLQCLHLLSSLYCRMLPTLSPMAPVTPWAPLLSLCKIHANYVSMNQVWTKVCFHFITLSLIAHLNGIL